MNNAKNCLLALLAVVAIGASILAWRQSQELVTLRAGAMKPAERAELQKRAWDTEKRARQLEIQLAAIRQADGSLPGATAGDGGGGTNSQGRVIGDVVNGWLSVMNDPEARRLMAQQQRAQIGSRYAELFRQLALPPEKLSQLKELLVEKQMVRNDVMLAATQQGINPLANPQEFRQLERNLQTEIDDKIKSTLGNDGYAEFQTYQQTQGQRSVVKQLEDSLSYTATPLSSAQSLQVGQILGQTGPARGNAPNKNNSIVTNDTITSSQNVLSPPQLQALKDIQTQQQSAADLDRLMRARQVDFPGAPGAMNGGAMPALPGRPGR